MMMKTDRRKEIKGTSYNVLAPLHVLSDLYGGSWGKWTGLAQDRVQRKDLQRHLEDTNELSLCHRQRKREMNYGDCPATNIWGIFKSSWW